MWIFCHCLLISQYATIFLHLIANPLSLQLCNRSAYLWFLSRSQVFASIGSAFLPKPCRNQSCYSCQGLFTHIPHLNWINEHNWTQATSSVVLISLCSLWHFFSGTRNCSCCLKSEEKSGGMSRITSYNC